MSKTRLAALRGLGIGNVDFENDIINDVVIVQEGMAKGHGVWLDAKFISDIAFQGNENSPIKSRFGHPNMCGNSLGDYLGVYKDFRVREFKGKTQAIANLHLDRTVADKSPKYDKSLIDYVLNFANKNPDMFGNSIVFSGKSEDRKVEVDGKKIAREYMILSKKGFTASDIVDDPAATEGMFSEYNIANSITEFIQLNNVDLGQFDSLLENDAFAKFTEMLLSNPKISHRILSIITNNKEIYQNFKSKIVTDKDVDLDKLNSMFNK